MRSLHLRITPKLSTFLEPTPPWTWALTLTLLNPCSSHFQIPEGELIFFHIAHNGEVQIIFN